MEHIKLLSQLSIIQTYLFFRLGISYLYYGEYMMLLKKIISLWLIVLAPIYCCLSMDLESEILPDYIAPLKIAHGTHAEQGNARPSMEDQHFPSEDEESMITDKIHFFGIYDGHRGVRAAYFTANYLHRNILWQLQSTDINADTFLIAYKLVDNQFITNHPKNPSGTTAVTALFKKTKLWIANVGDAQAVACFDGTHAECVTELHSPCNQTELERILNQGGTVKMYDKNLVYIKTRETIFTPSDENTQEALAEYKEEQTNAFLESYSPDGEGIIINKFHPVGRIITNVQLSPSRGIGDVESKPFCSNTPFVQSFEITQPGFIILACDGLWDVMSYQAAVNIVLRELMLKGLTIDTVTKDVANSIAQKLVAKALEIWDHDNVTATIIFFNPIQA